MPGEDDELTRLAHSAAAKALRWAYFNGPDDETNLIEATGRLLKAYNLMLKNNK